MTAPLALALLATLAGILAAALFVLVLAWHARHGYLRGGARDRGSSRHPSEVTASRAMHTCDRAGMTARRGDRPPR